ncbi:MAG: VWA domain-containing protein [Bacteriovoracaceae bacterium]|nr:VWA domain-containing protein [Bacteriovoracaceae bacterium]
MKFGNLQYLWFLWFIPGIIVFYFWAFKRKQKLLERFVSNELKERLLFGFSPGRQKLKAFFIIVAMLFAIISLIRPQWGFHWEEVKRKGVDIMVALDVSRSMLAGDVSPNRLERAKREIIDLMNIMQGDRLGLIAFAGTSFLQSPLTLDYGAVRIFLDDLDTSLIPVPGTAIADAIKKASQSFDQADKKSRVLILITDGEDHEGDPVLAAKTASENGIKIYTVGIGAKGGAPIPVQGGGFQKDRNGEMILTQMNETTLQKIALETGGSYVRSITGDLDLENIYKDITEKVEDKELKSGKRKRFEERFQWPLILALIFIILEVLVRERSTRKLLLIFLMLFALPQTGRSGIFKKDAQQLYDGGDYSKAVQKYLDRQMEDQDNPQLKYNLGNSYYKAKSYKEAYQFFSDSALKGDKTLSQKSYYNLGNTSYRLGKLPEAIKHYEQALNLNPDDADAKYNLEFAREELKKRIEENKKRQQQQKKQKQQQQNKKCDNPNANKQQQKNEQKQGEKQEKEQKQKDGQKKQQAQEQGSAQKMKKGSEKKLSKEEAMRWLRNLSENRKKHLKRRLRGDGHYQVEKDW